MLPDELQHQQLIKVGVQQRAHNGVKVPVMVMRAFREVDDHAVSSLPRQNSLSTHVGANAAARPPQV